MNEKKFNQNLFSYLSSSPTAFHAVNAIKDRLTPSGYIELQENEFWKLKKGKPYFVVRENGAIIVFVLGTEEDASQGFRMVCAHTDSPCLQVKPRPDITRNSLLQLGVELYGGALVAPWFDRDLSLAGRVNCLIKGNKVITLLIDFNKPLLSIPSIAIHLHREANNNPNINKQEHLIPIIAQEINNQIPNFKELLLNQIKIEHPQVKVEEILSYDIFCNDHQQPSYLGIDDAFIVAGKLDNLVSCCIGMTAMQNLDFRKNCLLFCANHEENGSTSISGAQGPFLDSVIDRILPDIQKKRIALANSFLVSMDNAHATHPNFPEKMDKNHDICLNMGPVIKINANQRYATNSISAAIYKTLCKKAKLCPQEFVMRNDMPCGSTIGPLTAARLGIRTIDVGVASLGMHSIRELTGRSDPYFLYQSIFAFMRSDVHNQIQNR